MAMMQDPWTTPTRDPNVGRPDYYNPYNSPGPRPIPVESDADAATRMGVIGAAPPDWAKRQFDATSGEGYDPGARTADPFLQWAARDASRRAAGVGTNTDRMIGDQSRAARGMYAAQAAGVSGRAAPSAMRRGGMLAAGANVQVNAAMQGQREQEMAAARNEAAGYQNQLRMNDVNRTLTARDYANQRDKGAQWWLQSGLNDEQAARKALQEWAGMTDQWRAQQQAAADARQKQYDEEAFGAMNIVKAIPLVGPVAGAIGDQALSAGIGSGNTSDVRAKENLRSARPEAQQLLHALAAQGPTGWEWNDETANQGTAYGTTTSALKKGGPMGRDMVDQSGRLEKIDGAGAVRGLLAAVAEQQRQIDSIAAGPVDAEDRQRRKERQWSAGPSTDPRASIKPPPDVRAEWNEGAGGYVPSDPMVAAAGRPVWDGRQWVSQGDGGAPRFRASSMSPAPPTAQR